MRPGAPGSGMNSIGSIPADSFDWRGLRVALVGPVPPPAGGMANQTRQLAELLEGEGAHVELVPVNPAYRPAWVGRVRGVRALFRLVPYKLHCWRAFARADVVHVMANSGWSWHLFAAPAIWFARLRGVPVVVNYRGGEAGNFLARQARWVRPTLRRAAALVVPSGFLVDVFATHGMQASIVPNIVNVERFRPDAAREPDAACPHFVVARNLEQLYGNDIALEAFARILQTLPGARLTLAGTGPEEAALRSQAERLGVTDRLSFSGRLDRDEMAELYRSADVLLNPTRVDNMPNSILEALASGLPVVCTRVGGVPYIVEHERTALLVPVDDAPALAEAALRLVRDDALRSRLIESGLSEARRYEWRAVREVLGAVYRDALAGGRFGAAHHVL